MAVDDVKVRLSAEGVREITHALKQVQKDADAAGRSAAGGVNSLTRALGSLKTLLPSIGITAGIAGIVAIGKAALDNADHIEKMAQITGSSAENFSVLAFGAKSTATSAEALEKGLVRLSSTLGALSRGSAEQVDLFEELGLSAKDFDGKDTVEAFAIISRALEKVPDGFKKVDIQRRIFGRGAIELQDLLQKVGVEGFDALTAKAQQFGAVVSTDTANKTEEFKRNLALVEVQSGSLARSLLADLLPATNEILKRFIETKNELGLIAASLEAVGRALKAIAIGSDVELARKEVKELEEQITEARRKLEKGTFKVPFLPFDIRLDEKSLSTIRNVLAEREALLITSKKKLDSLTGANGASTSKPKDDEDAKLASEKSVQDKITEAAKRGGVDRLNILAGIEQQKRAEIEKTAQVERAQLEAKLAGTGDLLATQQTLEAADLASIARRSAAAQAAFEADSKTASMKEQLTLKGAQQFSQDANFARILTTIEQQAARDRAAAAQALFNTKSSLLIELYNKEKEAQTKLVALEQQTTDFRKRATQAVTDITNANLSAEDQAALKVRAAWENEGRLRDAVLDGNIEKVKQLREEQLAAGKSIGGPVGTQIIDEATRLSDLSASKEKLALTGNVQDAKKGADDLAKQVADIKVKLDELSSATRVDVKVDLNKEALEGLVTGLRSRLADEVFEVRVKAVLDGAPAGATGGSASAPGLAEGGQLKGPGTPTSDSILMWGSRGEFMVRARAAQQPGGTSFLNDFNAGLITMDDIRIGMTRRVRLPEFADGGSIGAVVAAAEVNGAFDHGSSAGEMTHNIKVNGRQAARVQGASEQVEALVSALNVVLKGT